MIRPFHIAKTGFILLSLIVGSTVGATTAKGGFEATLTGLNNTGGFSSYDTTNVSGYSTQMGNFSLSGAIACRIDWTPVTGSGSTTGLVMSGNVLPTFCIEIPQDVYETETYNFQATALTSLPTSGPHLDSTKIAELSQLWGAKYSSLFVAGNQAQTDANYAAFQIAIWAIVYGNDLSNLSWNSTTNTFTSGTTGYYAPGSNPFTATGSDAYTAYTWLQNVQCGAWNSYDANLVGFALSQNGQPAQDQLAQLQNGYYVDSNGNIVCAPAPTALFLALSGILPCLALRRRLRGTQVA